ncbi:MAG: hypothetical protein GF393_00950, partial [Armatimonadia bacterium]|nr:hypothetical protein [Armatimonadia bacterium]
MFRTLHSRRGSAATVVVVVLVLALIAGGLWYFVLRSTPEKTVTGMLEAVRAGDEEALKAYLTEQSQEDAGLVLGLTRKLAGNATGKPRYTIDEPVISENVATVSVQFPLGDTISTLTGMETFNMPYVLHREGQTWLVDTADTQEELGKQFAGGVMNILRRFILPGGGLGA